MSELATAVARVGDAVDAGLAAVRATPGRVRAALAGRRYRWVGIVGAMLALVLYVVAIGDVALGGRAGAAGASLIEVAPDWPERLFRARAPYLFEPVLAVHPLAQLTVLVSPPNLVLGGLLAALVGLNLAVAGYAAAHVASCRRTGYGRVLAVVPALLTGVACCVPTFLVVLGSSTAAVLLPVVVPLRMLFYPLSLVLLAATLVWGARRL
jgi:hypothetical protein